MFFFHGVNGWNWGFEKTARWRRKKRKRRKEKEKKKKTYGPRDGDGGQAAAEAMNRVRRRAGRVPHRDDAVRARGHKVGEGAVGPERDEGGSMISVSLSRKSHPGGK